MQRVAIVTGHTSGLGELIALGLHAEGYRVIGWSLPHVDLRDWDSVLAAASSAPEKVDVLVNCAGVNGIDYLPNVSPLDWNRIMDTNARGIFYTTKALLEKLVDGTILNIVSNASHIPMTNSLAYNASKAAAAIMTKQLQRELGKTHGITAFSVSPNKLAGTGMSRYIEDRVCGLRGWSPEEAKKYQLAALPAGEETDPQMVAEFITFLLSTKDRHKFFAGCDIPYGA
jgi:NAD(P)-dependent dehydrogenase (short-subunit alcohol dehydrogenase family)